MRQRGHTLLEVTLTSVLVALLVVTTAAAARWSSLEIFRLKERTRAVAELRMALEYLRQDLSGATDVRARKGGGLRIRRAADVARLRGGAKEIEYRLEEGRLVRREVDRRLETVVALELDGFRAYEPDSRETRIHLTARDRSITLVWTHG